MFDFQHLALSPEAHTSAVMFVKIVKTVFQYFHTLLTDLEFTSIGVMAIKMEL